MGSKGWRARYRDVVDPGGEYQNMTITDQHPEYPRQKRAAYRGWLIETKYANAPDDLKAKLADTDLKYTATSDLASVLDEPAYRNFTSKDTRR